MPDDTREPLTEIQKKGRLLDLAERVDPAHTAILVVDVQNDFCSDKGAFGKMGYDMSWMDPMVAQLKILLEEARRKEVLIVFIRGFETGKFLNAPLSETYNRRGFIHGLVPKDTWESDWYDDLAPRDAPYEIDFVKHRFSSFPHTALDLYLRSNAVRTVIVTGVVTSGCIESTARDAFSEGYYVVVPPDCVADAAEARHQASLNKLGQAFGDIVPADDILAVWAKASGTERGWHGQATSGRALKEPQAQLDPMHTALVLVDLQEGFRDPEGAPGQAGEGPGSFDRALPRVEALLTEAREAGVMVIHVGSKNTNLTASDWEATWRECRQLTPRLGIGDGTAFLGRTGPMGDEEIILRHRTSAFSDTRLELLLRSNGIRTLVLAGAGLTGAISATAQAASDKDFYTFVATDASTSPASLSHLDAAFLEAMNLQFAMTETVDTITSVWQGVSKG